MSDEKFWFILRYKNLFKNFFKILEAKIGNRFKKPFAVGRFVGGFFGKKIDRIRIKIFSNL